MKFRAMILLSGKTATGIAVPAAVVDGLGGGKRPAVSVRINGYAYRSTVAPMGGVFMLPISSEHRQGAGVAAPAPDAAGTHAAHSAVILAALMIGHHLSISAF